MCRTLTGSLVLLCVLCVAAAAQPHGTDLIVGDTDMNSGTGRLLRVTPKGAVTTIGQYVSGPFINMVRAVAMDIDNRHVVAITGGVFLPTQLLRIDPASGRVQSTLWANAPTLTSLDVDQDGDYLVTLPVPLAGSALLKVKRDGSSISTVYRSSSVFFAAGDVAEDKNTGDWVFGNLFSFPPFLMRLDRNTLTEKTLPQPQMGGFFDVLVQDPHRPDVFIGTYGPILDYDPVANTLTTLAKMPSDFTAFELDRSPAKDGGLIYGARQVSAFRTSISVFDRRGNALGLRADLPTTARAIVFDRGRNLAPVLQKPPNNRIIRLSFPGDGGKRYVLALGLSGYTPGVALTDGRVIPLNPDELMRLTARQELRPLLAGNLGVLDAHGEAVVTFNVNTLGTAVKGVRIWAVAVTLDPRAPAGVSQVSAPLLFVL